MNHRSAKIATGRFVRGMEGVKAMPGEGRVSEYRMPLQAGTGQSFVAKNCDEIGNRGKGRAGWPGS
jgi:hypothetical protein